jgi:hypothetical protein
MKNLKLFNGRFHDKGNGQVHAYIAAYSRADAIRVITEYLGYKGRGLDNEIRVYWSQAWGDPMKGITPERVIWVQVDRTSKPEKRYPL